MRLASVWQVCAHIVQAIRMEATRVREEWEHAISSKENANSQPSDEDAASDAYCFELLSMVLALSGSNVGRQYLAQQLTLLQDLFSLLHTASPRVQRQVSADCSSSALVSLEKWLRSTESCAWKNIDFFWELKCQVLGFRCQVLVFSNDYMVEMSVR